MSEDALRAAADAASQSGLLPAPGQDGPRTGAAPSPAAPGRAGAPAFEVNLKAIHQFLASL